MNNEIRDSRKTIFCRNVIIALANITEYRSTESERVFAANIFNVSLTKFIHSFAPPNRQSAFLFLNYLSSRRGFVAKALKIAQLERGNSTDITTDKNH